jgi:hypothetical protein
MEFVSVVLVVYMLVVYMLVVYMNIRNSMLCFFGV